MRAAFCTGLRSLELRQVPEPEPGPDQTVVGVHACGICGSDLHYYLGGSKPPRVCLGHEIAGRLEREARGWAAGTPVVAEPLVACGACPRCRAGERNLCPSLRILGSLCPGGLADRVAVPTASLFRVPDGLDLDAAMLAEPLAVAVHATHLAGIHPGERALVLGGGVIGLLTTLTASRAGAIVTVSARHPHQARAALALGAAHVIAATRDAVLAGDGGGAPDLVFETVGGDAATLDLALEAVRAGGRIVALGVFTQPVTLHPLRFLVKEVHLVSSMTYCRRLARPDFEVALDFLVRERSLLVPLVTHRVPLADVARGFAVAADKSTGAIKVAVDIATG